MKILGTKGRLDKNEEKPDVEFVNNIIIGIVLGIAIIISVVGFLVVTFLEASI